MSHDESTWDHFAEVARAMSRTSGLDQTLERGVHGAVELIENCEHACISLAHKDGPIDTAAATSSIPRRGDELQYELGEGPCLQSIRLQETVISDDLTTEQRWPTWSKRAAVELGVRSMLCLQLFVTHERLGALNLYSTKPHAFDDEDRSTGLALAAHIAVALSAAQEEANLMVAIDHRTVIGQAQGMLMERYKLSHEQAFDVLARASQENNQKLYAVAINFIRNGVRLES